MPLIPDRVNMYKDTSTGADAHEKEITVRDGRMWKIVHLFIEFRANDAITNRQIAVQIKDNTSDSDVIFHTSVDELQTASQLFFYSFYPGAPRSAAEFDTDAITCPLPKDMWLPSGTTIHMFDRLDADSASDDLLYWLVIEEQGDVRSALS